MNYTARTFKCSEEKTIFWFQTYQTFLNLYLQKVIIVVKEGGRTSSTR